MNLDKAIAAGFTHEGSYCLIPIWFREVDATIAGKNLLYDWLILPASFMDRTAMVFTGEEMFVLHVRKIIKEPTEK
jgi:hypothetical protein